MYSIKQLQIKAIRAGFRHEKIYTEENSCIHHFKKGIIRGKISDIRLKNGNKIDFYCSYKVITKGKTFRLYYGDFKHTSSSIYVITIDDIVYYFNCSPVLAPAIDAFHVLSEVFHGYGKGKKSCSWEYLSTNKAICTYYTRWDKKTYQLDFRITKNQKEIDAKIEKIHGHF